MRQHTPSVLRQARCSAVLIALGLGLSAWAGAPTQPLPYQWDVPGIISEIDVPGPMQSLGVPVTLHVITSSEKIDFLIRHFVDSFRKGGLYLSPRAITLKMGRVVITGLDTERLVSYTVALRANQTGSTTVMMGMADLGQRQKAVGSPFAPVMPGAEGIITTDVEVGRMVAYRVKATEQDVTAFYRETLGKDGYEEAHPSTFRKGGEELRILTHEIKGSRSVVVLRQPVTELGPPPGD